jgi:hypothetical protein
MGSPFLLTGDKDIIPVSGQRLDKKLAQLKLLQIKT